MENVYRCDKQTVFQVQITQVLNIWTYGRLIRTLFVITDSNYVVSCKNHKYQPA